MTIKRIHAIVAVVGLMAAGSAAYVYQRQSPTDAMRSGAGNDASDVRGGTGAAARNEQGGPATVEVAKVEVMTLYDDAQAVGSLRSRQGVMLRPEVSGRVSKLGFVDGQKVQRGQMLVQLDDTLQQAQLKQALAQASIARTNLQRNRDLVAQNFVSKSAVDQTAAVLEVAEAQVAVAKAQLGRMRIVAPFDGIAGIRLISMGDFVKDGADLVNIEDVGVMLVDFRLPERLLARLKIGQAVDVVLDGMPGRNFAGRVEAVDAQLDADGRSLLVRARLDNRDGVLRPRHVRAHAHRVRGARQGARRARGSARAAGRQAIPGEGDRNAKRQGHAAHRSKARAARAGQGRDPRGAERERRGDHGRPGEGDARRRAVDQGGGPRRAGRPLAERCGPAGQRAGGWRRVMRGKAGMR